MTGAFLRCYTIIYILQYAFTLSLELVAWVAASQCCCCYVTLVKHQLESLMADGTSDDSRQLQPDDGKHCSSAVGLLAAVVALVFVQCLILNYGIFTLFL
jgi:hypothetical protein